MSKNADARRWQAFIDVQRKTTISSPRFSLHQILYFFLLLIGDRRTQFKSQRTAFHNSVNECFSMMPQPWIKQKCNQQLVQDAVGLVSFFFFGERQPTRWRRFRAILIPVLVFLAHFSHKILRMLHQVPVAVFLLDNSPFFAVIHGMFRGNLRMFSNTWLRLSRISLLPPLKNL